MKIETQLRREAGESIVLAGVSTAVAKPRGRPRIAYRLRVGSEKDVKLLRRRSVPLFLMTDASVQKLGYPSMFPPRLFVAADLIDSVESVFRTFPVRDRDALSAPGIEEIVTFLLVADPLASRAVLRRNARAVNPHELYRRVVNAGPPAEEIATEMRLHDFVPFLPWAGTPMSLNDARWIDRNDPTPPAPL